MRSTSFKEMSACWLLLANPPSTILLLYRTFYKTYSYIHTWCFDYHYSLLLSFTHSFSILVGLLADTRCLKITEKVSFNMASIGQKFIKNAKNAQFGEFLNFSRTKNCWKMPQFKHSNETFWVIFKQSVQIPSLPRREEGIS